MRAIICGPCGAVWAAGRVRPGVVACVGLGPVAVGPVAVSLQGRPDVVSLCRSWRIYWGSP